MASRRICGKTVERLRATVATKLNLEMAATAEMCSKALELRPQDVCLVPERRAELTTEGGLEVSSQKEALRDVVQMLRAARIRVSLFIDPDPRQIDAASETGADVVELHTGTYADVRDPYRLQAELARLQAAARHAFDSGLTVNGGHGLRLDNVKPIAAIPEIQELNIGHAIVSRAVLIGMEAAVREMRASLDQARRRS
jgi:pyridoxine 5-phosphate synthase